MAKGKKRKAAPGDIATNRQAAHRFEFLDRIECGVVLQGTEVKSLRSGTAQIKDGYANIRDGEIWLHNVHIPPYGPAILAWFRQLNSSAESIMFRHVGEHTP